MPKTTKRSTVKPKAKATRAETRKTKGTKPKSSKAKATTKAKAATKAKATTKSKARRKGSSAATTTQAKRVAMKVLAGAAAGAVRAMVPPLEEAAGKLHSAPEAVAPTFFDRS